MIRRRMQSHRFRRLILPVIPVFPAILADAGPGWPAPPWSGLMSRRTGGAFDDVLVRDPDALP